MSERCTKRIVSLGWHLADPSETVECGMMLPCPNHGPFELAVNLRKWDLIQIPKPTILELLGKWGLTRSEHRRVFDGHDSGDEDSRARYFGRWVCGRRKREFTEPGEHPACELDPNHWGPHDWETPPVPEPPPMFVYRRSVIATGGHDPGDES